MSSGAVPRVRFTGVELEEMPNDRCQARVCMAWRNQKFDGIGEGAATELGQLRCAAEATCGALRRVVPSTTTFEVLDLETVKVLDAQAVVVALAVHDEDDVRYSVGFCLIQDDNGAYAAVKSVLNGTNRLLARLLPA